MCKILGFPIGRRALPRLDAQRVRTRKNARGFFPRAPAEHVKIRRSPPTEIRAGSGDPDIHPLCRWRDGDRLIAIGAKTGTLALQKDMSGSGDLDLQRYGQDPEIRPYNPPVDGDRQIAIGTGSGDAAFISPASPPQTSSTHDAQATQAPATDASSTSPAYHQTKPPQSGNNAQHPASQTYR